MNQMHTIDSQQGRLEFIRGEVEDQWLVDWMDESDKKPMTLIDKLTKYCSSFSSLTYVL